MPCQDTLYEIRMSDDLAFAEASERYSAGRNVYYHAALELCRVGVLLADGESVGDVDIPVAPDRISTRFPDEWGDRIKNMANEDIAKAELAIRHLINIKNYNIDREAKDWLIEHWSLDLRRLERDNERHKKEILYKRGEKLQKRLERIASDTPEIERIKARIAWAKL